MPEKSPWPASIAPMFGGPAIGPQRFPRPDIEARVMTLFRNGSGCQCFGLRRIGKSTLMAHCADALRDDGYHVVDLNAEGMASEAELLTTILRDTPRQTLPQRIVGSLIQSTALPQALRAGLDQWIDEPTAVSVYLNAISDVMVDGLREAGDTLAVMIDELPFLCRRLLETDDPADGRQRVDRLFSAMRRWRGAGMKMMLTGSIGMTSLARQHRMALADSLNDLAPVTVPPFRDPEDRDQAATMVAALARGAGVADWSPAHTDGLLRETTAWYPGVLQSAFLTLTAGGRAVDPAVMPDLFATAIRPDSLTMFFTQFDRRLSAYRRMADPTPAMIDPILDAVVTARPDLLPRAALVAALPPDQTTDAAEVLTMLSEDGFLSLAIDRDGGRHYGVSSPLMLAWYRQR